MHKPLCLLAIVTLMWSVIACTAEEEAQTETVGADTISGSGDLGRDTMTYYVGFLGSVEDKEELSEDSVMAIQRAHQENIGRLADSGYMVLAGPFFTPDNSHDIRGLFFFKTDSEEQAAGFARNDPAVMAGRLEIDMHPWLGSPTMAHDYQTMEDMRTYQAAIYHYGPNASAAPDYMDVFDFAVDQLSAAVDTGSIAIAGPFTGDASPGDPFALFVFDADTITTVQQFAPKAPGIADSALTVTVLNWFGPKGLRE